MRVLSTSEVGAAWKDLWWSIVSKPTAFLNHHAVCFLALNHHAVMWRWEDATMRCDKPRLTVRFSVFSWPSSPWLLLSFCFCCSVFCDRGNLISRYKQAVQWGRSSRDGRGKTVHGRQCRQESLSQVDQRREIHACGLWWRRLHIFGMFLSWYFCATRVARSSNDIDLKDITAHCSSDSNMLLMTRGILLVFCEATLFFFTTETLKSMHACLIHDSHGPFLFILFLLNKRPLRLQLWQIRLWSCRSAKDLTTKLKNTALHFKVLSVYWTSM